MQVAVSTLAFMGKPAEEIISLAQKHNWVIEFSSGMPYRPDMEDIFLEAPIKKLAHNYFPAPKIPFVLNLASSNDAIRNISIQHCINGLKLSKQVSAPFFSAHAGFCVDPNPDELGRKLNLSHSFDRDLHWKLFIESVKKVAEEAKKLGIRFLIENNVLAQVNMHPDGSNPLFCCDAEEMLAFIREVGHPSVGLLIDTAHLKVSANTLHFNAGEAVEKIQEHVFCIHHSDNDGTFDTNEKMDASYWFLTHMSLFKDISHVIEVKKLSEEEVVQQLTILKD